MPELLAPAGDMECLQSALDYGCDAVYLGGKLFGMRAGPENFDGDNLRKAVELAHSKGVKVYLTCNTIPLNEEIELFPEFIKNAQECGVDAVIACDLGIISMVKKYAPNVDLHISTQTGVVNYQSAIELYNMGAKRIVVAREVDLENIKRIRDKIPSDMEIEAFVHGAMCVSFSGRCLLSSYLVNRNANRGECAQPCRWGYHLVEEKRPGEFYNLYEDERGTYIMNARDMCMIDHIDDLIKAGVDSFKIEGRAKSAYYVATIVNAYRAALNASYKGEKVPEWAIEEVYKISHRPYCTGFFYGHPNLDEASQDPHIITKADQYYESSGYIREYDFVGVIDKCENGMLYITQRNYFKKTDPLEVLAPGKTPLRLDVQFMFNSLGEEIEIANHALEKVTIKSDLIFPTHSILRKPSSK